MKPGLLGLDVGTTSTKAVVFDLDGDEIARAVSPPYRRHTTQPGWVEQDPEDLWQAVLLVLQTVMTQVRENIQVEALCLAAQSGSLLPADEGGNPVYPLITWMDGRTQDLVTRWRDEGIQDQVRSLSGWSLYPGLPLPTIAWLRQHDPQTFTAARHYFSVNDFLSHRLTGNPITNPSNAGGMQLVDIHTGAWSERLCALAGIAPQQLSKIQPSGAVIGEILPQICSATGLPTGSLLVNGGHDQGCTSLGLGIINPGRLLLACGTAWVFTGVRERVELTQIPATLDLNFHTVSGRWAVSQSLGGLGASLEWWLDQAWGGPNERHSRQERFSAMNAELVATNPSEGLFFLPLTGGHDDPATTRSGGFVGLRLGHNRADMARCIMESAAFELRWALEAVVKAGMPVDALSMVGGAAHSPHWPKILANATALSIHLPQYDNWPALGASILAGLGAGLFETIPDALSQFQKSVHEIAPEPLKTASYNASFESYQKLYRTMQTQDTSNTKRNNP